MGLAMTSLSIRTLPGCYRLECSEPYALWPIPLQVMAFAEIDSRPDPITRIWDRITAKRGLGVRRDLER